MDIADASTPEESILDCWNSQFPRGRLKKHRKIDPPMKRAINENLREGWDVEDMMEAIVNFCICVSDKRTFYGDNGRFSQPVQKWGLFEFLHRGCQDEEKGKRWVKFTDNRFRLEDTFTDSAIKNQIKERRLVDIGDEILQQNARVPYSQRTTEELQEAMETAIPFEQEQIKKVLLNRENT